MESPTRRRDFYLVWGGQSLSVLFTGAASVALSLWVFEVTGSATQLSTILALRLGLGIFLAPLAGVVADRWDRRRLIVVCDVVLAGVSLASAGLISSAPSAVWALFVAVAVAGVFENLLLVTLAASLRDLRNEADLTRAAAWVGFLDRAPAVAAPALGAVIYSTSGAAVVLAIDAATFLLAGCGAVMARYRPESSSRAVRRSATLVIHESVAGVRAIWASRDFRRLQLLNSTANVINGLAISSIAVLILTSSERGEAVFGLFNSATTLGLVLGALIVAAIGTRVPRSRYVSWGLGLSALCGRIAVGLAHHPLLWIGGAFVRGIGQQVSNVALTALWTEKTAPQSQGRIFGARRLLGQGPYPLAVLLGGAITDQLALSSIGLWLVVLGLIELVLVAVLTATKVVDRCADPDNTFDLDGISRATLVSGSKDGA